MHLPSAQVCHISSCPISSRGPPTLVPVFLFVRPPSDSSNVAVVLSPSVSMVFVTRLPPLIFDSDFTVLPPMLDVKETLENCIPSPPKSIPNGMPSPPNIDSKGL